MEKYEVLGLAGEGSFGRVYKAKQKDTQQFVAYKVISKLGRSKKELDTLRQECKVQRNFNHPNVIQMIDSFETDGDIVVVTEFVDKQLYALINSEGPMPEELVRQITCDLVSALFYLHSNRVLHRDLKPQNILIDALGKAKLCDFGFARHMGRGTMLLTSIKGTPLYMAPELIKESPYDHNADLWSLGCIVYELLIGVPPFKTSNVMHLVRLVHNEQIKFPQFASQDCISFLQGLLQKDPRERLTWPDLIYHPFLKGDVLVQQDLAASLPPLTEPLSDSQQLFKETQRQILLDRQPRGSKLTKFVEYFKQKVSLEEGNVKTVDGEPMQISPSTTPTPDNPANSSSQRVHTSKSREKKKSKSFEPKSQTEESESDEENQVQNFEWLDYLHRSMEEVFNHDLSCVFKPPLVKVATSPLLKRNFSPQVYNSVACLLILPFITEDRNSTRLKTLLESYAESNVVDLLVQGMWTLLAKKKSELDEFDLVKSKQLSSERLLAIENIILLLSYLVYKQPYPKVDIFLNQFCNAVKSRGSSFALVTRHLLTLSKRRPKIVSDTLSIYNHIIRILPSQSLVVLEAIIGNSATKAKEKKQIDLGKFLDSPNAMLRLNTCVLIRYLTRKFGASPYKYWDESIKQKLVRNAKEDTDLKANVAAGLAVEVIKKLDLITSA
ncbi:serine/threonine-protein kinase 36 [Cloeon dipterum]|uniref:serine/threonine-protein kinase 36 n=1 Tax=Cloeon dipterum TaxID=197152 RepID=UPI0032206B7B